MRGKGMKKVYEKPLIMKEEYQLSDYVAACSSSSEIKLGVGQSMNIRCKNRGCSIETIVEL